MLTDPPTTDELEAFTDAYVAAALWSSTDYPPGTNRATELGPDGEYAAPIPLDNYDGDLSPDALDTMRDDASDFLTPEVVALIRVSQGDRSRFGAPSGLSFGWTFEQAGHDFWLTRNGHGTGFWDRTYANDVSAMIGDELADQARSYGEVDLYIGDDGAIHHA